MLRFKNATWSHRRDSDFINKNLYSVSGYDYLFLKNEFFGIFECSTLDQQIKQYYWFSLVLRLENTFWDHIWDYDLLNKILYSVSRYGYLFLKNLFFGVFGCSSRDQEIKQQIWFLLLLRFVNATWSHIRDYDMLSQNLYSVFHKTFLKNDFLLFSDAIL